MTLRVARWFATGTRAQREGGRAEALALAGLIGEIEDGLRAIDFAEVTVEDRIDFVESAVVFQVRRALQLARFDLALALQRYGVQRITDLERGRLRPGLRVIHGDVTAGAPHRAPGSARAR